MSPSASPSPSPNNDSKSPNNPNLASLPPLNTNYSKHPNLQRPVSYAKSRMSSYSNLSNTSQNRSRPGSTVFPHFHSSLPYALVRDFAYDIKHPFHYGPPPESSGATSVASTPTSEHQRQMSDSAEATWGIGNSEWTPNLTGPWAGEGMDTSDERLPQRAYGDGPPYSEDEDLHSPVIVSSRHKKHKLSFPATSGENGKRKARSSGPGVGDDDDEDYFGGSTEAQKGLPEGQGANGFHGSLVADPRDHMEQSTLAPSRYTGNRDSHFAAMLPNRSYRQEDEASQSSADDQSGPPEDLHDSRYSKDYHFTIASPDEEMHGKAVALFDFTRENENELPLSEGQVIWVSYRHGQGWLVAEDPKTGDKGLVPEEYVRLVRDIEGGLNSLSGDPANERDFLSSAPAEPQLAVTPAQTDPLPIPISDTGKSNINGNGYNGSDKRPVVVSTFSTSSKDLDPYPQHLLDKQAGQLPPQVIHYGSQANTPTLTSPASGARFSRGNSDSTLLSKSSFPPKHETDSSEDPEDTEQDDSGGSDDDDDDSDDEEFHDSKEQQKS
ncbi:MAG: hypothetical protein LQ346_007100 [Caloplaca aetnensis]|nr:MAG: hypothetical protein LQ346_007100 [Caloplaca aetnensis]